MARQLQGLGFDAAALAGGYKAWRAEHPVEPKGTSAPTVGDSVPNSASV